MLKSTLQHFAGDFGQTALNSLRFLKGNLAGAPNLGIFGNEDTSQHQELRSLPFARSAWVFKS